VGEEPGAVGEAVAEAPAEGAAEPAGVVVVDLAVVVAEGEAAALQDLLA